ncbi:MAG: DUF5063 domain-containing protein [Thermosynechococcaceae cyanobacterium]
MGKSSSVQNFAHVARVFIDWVEQTEQEYTASAALRNLGALYLSALQLPPPYSEGLPDDEHQLGISASTLDQIYIRASKLPFQYYGVVFNSLEMPPGSPVVGDIADDIRDIYGDVKIGLLLFEQGRLSEACWEWGYMFRLHWGKHLTGAIQSLHDYLANEDWDGLSSN